MNAEIDGNFTWLQPAHRRSIAMGFRSWNP